MKLPIDPVDVYKSAKGYISEKDKAIRVGLFLDHKLDKAIESEARLTFTPRLSTARIRSEYIGDTHQIPAARLKDFSFAAVVINGPEQDAEMLNAITKRVGEFKDIDIPCLLISTSGKASKLAATFGTSILDVVIVDEPSVMQDRVAAWATATLKQDRLALAANYPFMRDEVAMEFVKSTSMQNALVGGLLFIPGADMPVMTLNQMKMVMQMAAAFDQKLDKDRIKELVAVLAGGFLFRTIARELVGLVPLVGWAVKAGIAYSGTYAMGLAALKYFESGGNLEELGTFLKNSEAAISAKAKEIYKERKDDISKLAEKNKSSREERAIKRAEGRAQRQAKSAAKAKLRAEARAETRAAQAETRIAKAKTRAAKTNIGASRVSDYITVSGPKKSKDIGDES